MGACEICGQPAGVLRKVHKACEQRRIDAWEAMVRRARSVASGREEDPELHTAIARLSSEAFAPDDWNRKALVVGWEAAVDQALEDGVLTETEEQHLEAFIPRFELALAELNARGALERLGKAKVLRDLVEKGVVPKVGPVDGLPFNLVKSESLVWLFKDVAYHELRTRTHYEGKSAGVSIRIAKGVYYRTSSFTGHPVETIHAVRVDTGFLGATTKHVYFSGPMKSFRVPYTKIVNFTKYSDGIGIQRDAMTAKPQTFVTGDGWFTYNLLTNLSNLS